MANKLISELTEETAPSAADVVEIDDGTNSRKVQLGNLGKGIDDLLNASGEGLTVDSDGTVTCKLGDAAGAQKFSLTDSGDAEKFSIDSDGNVSASGTLGVTGAATLSSTLAVTGAAALSSTLAVTGITTLSDDLRLPDGTVASPSCTFSDDLDSGMYRIGANNIGIGVGGSKVLDIGAAGLGVTGTLDVTGDASTADLTVNNVLGVGVDDTTRGFLHVYGPSSGPTGAILYLYLSGDHDDVFDYFYFKIAYDDLKIKPSTDAWSITIKDDGDLELPTNLSVASVITSPGTATNDIGTERDLLITAATGETGYDSSIEASKMNITDMEDPWPWFMKIKPINFERRIKPGVKDYGVTAEQMHEINPAFVSYDYDIEYELDEEGNSTGEIKSMTNKRPGAVLPRKMVWVHTDLIQDNKLHIDNHADMLVSQGVKIEDLIKQNTALRRRIRELEVKAGIN